MKTRRHVLAGIAFDGMQYDADGQPVDLWAEDVLGAFAVHLRREPAGWRGTVIGRKGGRRRITERLWASARPGEGRTLYCRTVEGIATAAAVQVEFHEAARVRSLNYSRTRKRA